MRPAAFPPLLAVRDAALRNALGAALRTAGVLLALEACLGAAVHLVVDHGTVALVLALAYLALCLGAARALATQVPAAALRLAAAALAGALWQAPGLAGTLNRLAEVAGWKAYDGASDLFDFAMQTAHTVLMPVLVRIPDHGEWAGYYRGLVWTSPVLWLALVVVALPRRSGRCTRRAPAG